MKVSRQLRELIADSTSIQYRLELYRAGYENNIRASQPSIATRREQLREYQTAWLDGEPVVLVREAFKGTSGPELTGDTLVTMGRARMSFNKLPSKAKGMPTKRWTVDLAFDGWSVAMHPPTNAVAVSEYTGSISYVHVYQFFHPVRAMLTTLRACRSIPVHILRMDTGQPHPLASIPAIHHCVRDNFAEIYPPYMSISQSILAILFRESGQADQVIDEDRLFVWNWRTGALILVSSSR